MYFALLCGSDSRPLGQVQNCPHHLWILQVENFPEDLSFSLSELPWALKPAHSSHLNRIPAQSLKGRTGPSTTSTILHEYGYYCTLLGSFLWRPSLVLDELLEDKFGHKRTNSYMISFIWKLPEESIRDRKQNGVCQGQKRGGNEEILFNGTEFQFRWCSGDGMVAQQCKLLNDFSLEWYTWKWLNDTLYVMYILLQ